MPNLMQRGATWLGSKLQTAGGRAVVYRRGASLTCALTATPQMHKRIVMVDGLPVETVVYSWTVTASELRFSGERFEPRAGDLVIETLNDSAKEWELLDLDDKTPCWEWADSSGILLLIHTKDVS